MSSTCSRNAIAVRAINIDNEDDVRQYHSLVAATKALVSAKNVRVSHSDIKRWIDKKLVRHGFRWEMVPVEIGARNAELQHPPTTAQERVYTFHDCVESIFNGGRVRVTDDNPRRVSVFDLIEVITDTKNPRTDFENMCRNNHEIVELLDYFKFAGQGQRETPVTTAEGVLMIVNLLPGRRASQFRMSAMQTLVRFLAGDQSLHEEIDNNALRQDQLSEQHPMRVFTETVNANPDNNRFVLHSPSMRGKYISQFGNKRVVYLLQWQYKDESYIKVGWTDNFASRMKDHSSVMPGFTIWCVVETRDNRQVELAWKRDFSAFNKQLEIHNKVRTELFTGITIEEAEQHLHDLVDEHKSRDAAYLDRQRMDHELEMKRLELQILQTQLALTQVASAHATATVTNAT